MEAQAAQSVDTKLHFDLLRAEYGYIGYCLSQDLTDKAPVWQRPEITSEPMDFEHGNADQKA